MSVRPSNEFSHWRFLLPFLALLVICYFAFHAFGGQYGIQADLAMRKEIERLEIILAQKIKIRENLQAQVAPLEAGENLDLDMVDELLRRQHNLVKKDELIIWRNSSNNEIN